MEVALESLADETDPLRRAEHLRRVLGPALGREASLLAELRRRAQGRLPHAERLSLEARRLEQATHQDVARARAERILERAPGSWVLDATAGLGGDSLVLGAAGLALVACDRDPETARRLRLNLQVAGLKPRVLVARAEAPAVRTGILVLDPDRRGDSGQRAVDPQRASPDLDTAIRLAGLYRGASVQLAPGVDPALVDRAATKLERKSLEWVSLRGELRELGLWTGCLAHPDGPAVREVLVLGAAKDNAEDGLGAARWAARPETVLPLETETAARVPWIVEPDPAIVRAGLVGALARDLGLSPLGPGIAYLGGSEPPASRLARRYRVIGSSPLDRRRVRALLGEHGVGRLVVKKRGHPKTAEELAAQFAGKGSRLGLLIVTRLADSHRAYLAESAP